MSRMKECDVKEILFSIFLSIGMTQSKQGDRDLFVSHAIATESCSFDLAVAREAGPVLQLLLYPRSYLSIIYITSCSLVHARCPKKSHLGTCLVTLEMV